jgi:shikimate dehydrogenase
VAETDSFEGIGDVNSSKLLVGLIGEGIAQSLSPSLHEEEARCHGLKLHYQLIDLAKPDVESAGLPFLLKAAAAAGFRGLNITHPCKQAVIPLLDALSADAQALGAVNTVVIDQGRFVGHNTDWSGFSMGFRQALPDASLRHVVLLGAGGAGAAVGHAILKMGAQALSIADTDGARAEALASRLAAQHPAARVSRVGDAAEALAGASGLIHATPTGMDKHPGMPIAEGALAHRPWVAEVVYFPIETELLKAARARGCAVADGGGMAVGQAIGAFELFTGRKADAARMEAHFRGLLESNARAGARASSTSRESLE